MNIGPVGDSHSIQRTEGVTPKQERPLPPNISPTPPPLPTKTLSQIKAARSTSSLAEAQKNLSNLKKKFLKEYNQKPQQRLIKKAFPLMTPLIEGSIPHQERFADAFATILQIGDLGKNFEQFLDLYEQIQNQTIQDIQDQNPLKMETGARLLEKRMEAQMVVSMYQLSEKEQKAILDLQGLLCDSAALINAQIFSEYLMNPLYEESQPEFTAARARSPAALAEEMGRTPTTEERVLEAKGYYSRHHGLQYGTHRFQRLSTAQIAYTIGIASAGSRIYEATIEVDFTPFLPENPTFKDLEKVLKSFKDCCNAAVKGENDYFNQKSEEGQRKLAACVIGVAAPKADFKGLTNDCADDFAVLVNRVQQAEALLSSQLENTDIKALGEIVQDRPLIQSFTMFLKAAKKAAGTPRAIYQKELSKAQISLMEILSQSMEGERLEQANMLVQKLFEVSLKSRQ